MVNASLGAFQYPAYLASTSLLVPKQHLGRAAGLGQLSDALSMIVTPLLAGFLVVAIKLEGVILIDFATFLFAVLTLLLVRIPLPKPQKQRMLPRHGMLGRQSAWGGTRRKIISLTRGCCSLALSSVWWGGSQILPYPIVPLFFASPSCPSLAPAASPSGR